MVMVFITLAGGLVAATYRMLACLVTQATASFPKIGDTTFYYIGLERFSRSTNSKSALVGHCFNFIFMHTLVFASGPRMLRHLLR
jgi:hypothetical protein